MDLVEEIAESLGIATKQWRGGELYLPLDDARRLVEACRERRIAVLGIEVFEVHGDGIMPRMDLIGHFEYSFDDPWDYQAMNSTSIAITILEEGKQISSQAIATLKLRRER